jgi:hypothetical protein
MQRGLFRLEVEKSLVDASKAFVNKPLQDKLLSLQLMQKATDFFGIAYLSGWFQSELDRFWRVPYGQLPL